MVSSTSKGSSVTERQELPPLGCDCSTFTFPQRVPQDTRSFPFLNFICVFPGQVSVTVTLYPLIMSQIKNSVSYNENLEYPQVHVGVTMICINRLHSCRCPSFGETHYLFLFCHCGFYPSFSFVESAFCGHLPLFRRIGTQIDTRTWQTGTEAFPHGQEVPLAHLSVVVAIFP